MQVFLHVSGKHGNVSHKRERPKMMAKIDIKASHVGNYEYQYQQIPGNKLL